MCNYSSNDDLLDFFFFQAEDGIRDLVRSRGLGDVYKRQVWGSEAQKTRYLRPLFTGEEIWCQLFSEPGSGSCLLYTSDAADERSSVDLGGSRIIKKNKEEYKHGHQRETKNIKIEDETIQ